MPSLSPGQTASIVLDPDDSYTVSTSGVATVRGIYGAPSTTTTLTANWQKFGPYGVPTKLDIAAVSGAANYSLDQYEGDIARVVSNPVTGEVTIPDPNDSTVSYALTQRSIPVEFPDEVISVITTGGTGVVAHPCRIVGIRARSVTAGPLTFTVYDNVQTAAGVVLWTGSLNTGGYASIPDPILAITGAFLSVTGAGTLDFTIRSIDA
jgi:hypothetical protein